MTTDWVDDPEIGLRETVRRLEKLVRAVAQPPKPAPKTKRPPRTVIKTFRTDTEAVEAVKARAAYEGVSESDLLRMAAERLRPVGFSCQHMNITAGGGVITAPPTVWCGCTMQPVYR